MAAEIRTSPNLVVGAPAPKPLFKFGSTAGNARFAVSADGQRVLVLEIEQADESNHPEIALVVNWAAEIK